MIPFATVSEPADFDRLARLPGRKWLDDHPASVRPRDFWSAFKPALAEGFRGLCGYSAMYEPVGTVDHFTPCDADRMLAYEWANYRFASAWINSSKQTADGIVLDPFEVREGWFKILLPSLQLVCTDRIPPELREKAEFTLIRLHLRDDRRVIRQRRNWLEMYESGKLSLEGLRDLAPLIAAAVMEWDSLAPSKESSGPRFPGFHRAGG